MISIELKEKIILTRSMTRNGMIILVALCAVIILFVLLGNTAFQQSFIETNDVANFKTILISLILEAFPFILLGVILSAILQTFVSEEMIRRLTPQNPVLAICFASVLGILFPICECGMIPVIRRLIRKGMPIYIAVVFILVGPILNPVVFASTYMAFRSSPEIAYSRMGLAFVVAFTIGLLLYTFLRVNPLRSFAGNVSASHPNSHGHQGAHHHEHNPHHEYVVKENRLVSTLSHASDEFFEMGKYLMLGAILTSLIQTFVVRESLIAIGQGDIWSHFFMMGFAYILSICSTSDAFIAASFSTTFTAGSLLTFLTFGPMLDLKGTLMLLTVFNGKFVLKLSLLIVITVFAGSLLFDYLFLH
jgi:uncharacterized membrane protein YraQ (UPF0718 family)